MYVKLHSVDEIRDGSRGKTVKVHSNDYAVTSSSSGLTVKARDQDWIGTGERLGTPKVINRTLILEFTAQDVKRLVDEALSSGLLTATIAIPKYKNRTRGVNASKKGQSDASLSIQLVPSA